MSVERQLKDLLSTSSLNPDTREELEDLKAKARGDEGLDAWDRDYITALYDRRFGRKNSKGKSSEPDASVNDVDDDPLEDEDEDDFVEEEESDEFAAEEPDEEDDTADWDEDEESWEETVERLEDTIADQEDEIAALRAELTRAGLSDDANDSDTLPDDAPPLNDTCPWSGDPVSPEALTAYRGHVVGFCTPACRDKFNAALGTFDKLIIERAKADERDHEGEAEPEDAEGEERTTL